MGRATRHSTETKYETTTEFEIPGVAANARLHTTGREQSDLYLFGLDRKDGLHIPGTQVKALIDALTEIEAVRLNLLHQGLAVKEDQ